MHCSSYVFLKILMSPPINSLAIPYGWLPIIHPLNVKYCCIWWNVVVFGEIASYWYGVITLSIKHYIELVTLWWSFYIMYSLFILLMYMQSSAYKILLLVNIRNYELDGSWNFRSYITAVSLCLHHCYKVLPNNIVNILVWFS